MKNKDNNTQLHDFVEALLDDALTLEIKMQGYSMFPTLKNGDTAHVEKCAPDKVKRGDILVFKHKGKFIAHRFLKLKSENGHLFFLAKGDNNRHYDPLFNEKELVGKVISATENGKIKSVNSFSQLFRKKLTLLFPNAITLVNNKLLQFLNRIEGAKDKFANLRTNYKLAATGSGKEIFQNAVIALLQGVLPFVLIICIKWLIDYLTQTSNESTQQLFSFYGLLILTALVFLANGVTTELRGFFGEKLTQSIAKRMYTKVQQKHLSLQLSHLENPSELDKIHRAVQEATFRPVKFINELLTLLKSMASAVFLAGLFLTIKWYLVVMLIVAVIPGVLIRFKFARRFHKLKDAQSPAEREMYYYNRVLTGFPFAKEIKLFHFSSFFTSRFKNLQKRLFGERIALRKSEVSWNVASHLFTVLLIFASLAYVSYLKIQGEITIGAVVLFFFAFQRGYSVLSELFKSGTQLLEDTSYLEDVRKFFDIKDSVVQHRNRMELKQSIRVENVSFSYETSKREALKNVSITIPAGKTIAIVGANGSGKSTFIKLLCGFYYPTSGEIFYDDKNTVSLGQQAISKNMAAVFQDFALYNVSALQNIALGNIDEKPDLEKITEAAKAAGIHDVLENLPQGYHTILGNIFNGGEELSMGQWQKLAVARAFYRNADLLIMDEPSSALDVYSETQIMDSLRKMAEDKTAIIISHRLTSVQWADEIYLFDKGEIIEHGSHEDLMTFKSNYYKLYQATRKSQ
jgi:ATP-binding cassette subfamily B protein